VDALERCPKPVIAAVNGYAFGGGCELALGCHLRLASENAVLGLPEVGLGILPGYGGTQRLPRLVGQGRALELILTGRRVRADEAERIGLVNRVVPLGELLAEAEKLALAILRNAPLAVEAALEAVIRGMSLPLGEGLRFEAGRFGILAASEDMHEGMRAFLEKRPATFHRR
jgi:enoyl-CoA hydratase